MELSITLMIWQFIINGLITGILYSLLAIGFALVYKTTRIFHIAAAGIYVFAAYMFWFFVARAGLPVIPASLVAIMLTMLLSLLSEVCVYRPLKNRKASLNVIINLIMAQLNPMQVRLQRKIEQHNKNVQQTIDKVATRQKFITIEAICKYSVIYFLNIIVYERPR